MEFVEFSESGYIFKFPKNYKPYVADKPTYTGLSAVDFVLEMQDKLVFIEVKNLDNHNIPKEFRKKQRNEFLIQTKKSAKCKICPKEGNCPRCDKIPFVCKIISKLKDTLLKGLANGTIPQNPVESEKKSVWYILLFECKDFNFDQRTRLFELINASLPKFSEDEYAFIKVINFDLYDIEKFSEICKKINISLKKEPVRNCKKTT